MRRRWTRLAGRIDTNGGGSSVNQSAHHGWMRAGKSQVLVEASVGVLAAGYTRTAGHGTCLVRTAAIGGAFPGSIVGEATPTLERLAPTQKAASGAGRVLVSDSGYAQPRNAGSPPRVHDAGNPRFQDWTGVAPRFGESVLDVVIDRARGRLRANLAGSDESVGVGQAAKVGASPFGELDGLVAALLCSAAPCLHAPQSETSRRGTSSAGKARRAETKKPGHWRDNQTVARGTGEALGGFVGEVDNGRNLGPHKDGP
ncbi:hypothetical protein ACCO45_002273 [Purpureocillium lilacinum]|uniref:Uncharacterized protein n=1 Tax=Purpureocillium lilacinum TaxID=33203 RepID=A0ACC4E9F5_PURLI